MRACKRHVARRHCDRKRAQIRQLGEKPELARHGAAERVAVELPVGEKVVSEAQRHARVRQVGLHLSHGIAWPAIDSEPFVFARVAGGPPVLAFP